MSIQPLPPEVIAQIKSSTTITSLNGVVCELLKNSLDASSTKVEITLDYSRGNCVVEDDGSGILPSEFGDSGGLGKLHHSSKLTSQTPTHGGRGTFLASLSATSLLSITSRHHQHHSHNTVTMHRSSVVSRQTPAPSQQHLATFSHGTRVTVRDLFGNMPVRVKHRVISAEKPRGNSKEWDELRRDCVLLLLAWPKGVAVTIREVVTNDKIVFRENASLPVSTGAIDLPSICNILYQACLISIEDKAFWVSARASTQKIIISAAISLLPSATKHTQFISFGIRPLFSHDAMSVLHDEINHMFINSTFGNYEEIVELDASEIDRRAKDKRYKGDGYTNKELKGGKKGVDRWPMFYINIQQGTRSTDGNFCDLDDVLDDKGDSLGSIVDLLQVLTWEFLTKHHFRPKATRRSRSNRVAREERRIAAEPEISSLSAECCPSSQGPLNVGNVEPNVSRGSHREPVANSKISSSRLPLSKEDTPFDLWSRIKRGSKPDTLRLAEKVPDSSDEGVYIPRPFSTPPRSTPTVSSPTEEQSRRSTTPLLSNNGKIIRRPFEDVASVATSLVSRRKEIALPLKAQSPLNEIREDIVIWTNPVTKVKSFVNQRTGLTVRADMSNLGKSQNSSNYVTPVSNHKKLNKNTVQLSEEPSPWLNNILKSWNNPVFAPAELSIPQVSFDRGEAVTGEILHGRHHHCSQIDIERAFKESSAGIYGRISKTALSRAEVISQVDNKFILVKLDVEGEDSEEKMLVLIDQHAADERIRIEKLLEEFFVLPRVDTAMPIISGVATELLDKPLTFELSSKESRLLQRYEEYFLSWGILCDVENYSSRAGKAVTSAAIQRLTVRSLPPGITERCKVDPRLLIDLIRTEAWKLNDEGGKPIPVTQGDWFQRIHSCPQGIIDMLNSRACRSAIMFNDELTKEQCVALVWRLAACRFPFQCAHGRPSLVPLVDLGRMDMRAPKLLLGGQVPGETFGAQFNRWRRNVN